MRKTVEAREWHQFISRFEELKGTKLAMERTGMAGPTPYNAWYWLDKGNKIEVAGIRDIVGGETEYFVESARLAEVENAPNCIRCKVFVKGTDGFTVTEGLMCNHCWGDAVRAIHPIEARPNIPLEDGPWVK